MLEFKDIPESLDWSIIKKVDGGYSRDKKYYAETFDGQKYLLRTAGIEFYDYKVREFEFVKKVNSLDFIMTRAVAMGKTDEFTYSIMKWVDGVPLSPVLPTLSLEEQYKLGMKAGKILKSIHSLPVNESEIFDKHQIEYRLGLLDTYEKSNVRMKNDDAIIEFVRKNIEKTEPVGKPVGMHGDFHPENMLYTPDGDIAILDFNRFNYGDVPGDFVWIQTFGLPVSLAFALGQIHSYFNGDPPADFWERLAVHSAFMSLVANIFITRLENEEVKEYIITRAYNTWKEFDNFKRTIPIWYVPCGR